MAPPGLTALGAKGSVRDRLTPPGRVEGSALGSYEAPLRWRCGRPYGRHFLYRLWRRKPYNRPGGRGKCNPPLVAGATTLPGGKHVTGFSVAYGSLRIQFLCHPRSSVGRQKESALMGRLGALLRPTWRSYAGPPQGTIKLRYAVSCL